MELLSELFSPFDNFELICEEHGISCIGLCSNILCKEKVKLLCMKCIQSGNTCISKEKHELITISEILFRYYKTKNESKEKIIEEILKMNNIVNNYNKNDLNNLLSEFKIIKNNKNINQIERTFFELVNYFSEAFKLKNNKNLEKIKDLSKSNKKYEKDINNFLNIKIPQIDEKIINDNKKLKDVIKNGKLSNPKIFVNSVKLLNNKNKCIDIAKRLNKKIYANKIYSNMSIINDNRTKFENKIDNILIDLEKKFDKKMEKIEKSIIIPREDNSIYISSNNNISFLNFSSDPKNLIFRGDICSTAHKINSIDKVFCAFKSFTNEKYVVWSTSLQDIEFFDLEKNQIIKTIKNSHINIIYSCRHFPDKKNKIDYLITSSYDRNVKIWNVYNFSCVLTLFNAHMSNQIYSVCILCEQIKNKNYIITSCTNDFMKIWDFSGKLIDKFGLMDENTYFIDSYYDNKFKKYYILNGNFSDVKSYDFEERELYKRYKGIPQSWHMSAIIYENKQNQILVESDGNGYIRMWEFHTASLIKSIFTNYLVNLRGICLWNERYLFAAANDHQIKLFDLIEGKYIKLYKEHISTVCTLDKIKTKKYGECLLSQGLDGKIKIWSQ
jgi:WD40 repeat protein